MAKQNNPKKTPSTPKRVPSRPKRIRIPLREAPQRKQKSWTIRPPKK